ncbi:poly ADP-ribose polymerase 12-like [Arapaima gigas]
MHCMSSITSEDLEQRYHEDNNAVVSFTIGQQTYELSFKARAVVERWYTAPGVRRVAVSERGVSGTLFLPPDSLQNFTRASSCGR